VYANDRTLSDAESLEAPSQTSLGGAMENLVPLALEHRADTLGKELAFEIRDMVHG
jgi:hypothetical protein